VTRFGPGIAREVAAAAASLGATGILVVADRRVTGLHGAPVRAPAREMEGGEGCKTLEVWRRILDACVAGPLDRDGVLVALGGGALLDVAGFAAAAYLRGIRWLAVPTTLLAQVDAAHGGKTGVDLPAAKNLVGAFHAPAAVLCDTDYLATLPAREIAGGLAEVVKHAVLGAPGLLDRAGRDDPATLVEEAARVKLGLVERDPFERGERRLLNLGHTLGHALEHASGYALHHGEAVALGLRAACALAEGHCGFRERGRVEEALDRCGLPARAALDAAAVRAALHHDKKRSAGRLRWILPVALGDVRVFDDVTEEEWVGALGR
jgi:3-dehydroquinate synthetase